MRSAPSPHSVIVPAASAMATPRMSAAPRIRPLRRSFARALSASARRLATRPATSASPRAAAAGNRAISDEGTTSAAPARISATIVPGAGSGQTSTQVVSRPGPRTRPARRGPRPPGRSRRPRRAGRTCPRARRGQHRRRRRAPRSHDLRRAAPPLPAPRGPRPPRRSGCGSGRRPARDEIRTRTDRWQAPAGPPAQAAPVSLARSITVSAIRRVASSIISPSRSAAPAPAAAAAGVGLEHAPGAVQVGGGDAVDLVQRRDLGRDGCSTCRRSRGRASGPADARSPSRSAITA